MKTKYRATCVRRKRPDPLIAWARRCAACPASFGATEREGQIVAELLADVEAGR